MGWTFNAHPCSKESFVNQILMESGSILAHSVRGNRLWTIYQPRSAGADPFIVLFLLKCSDGCWGYKDMDETMGPYFYDCPLSFLNKTPETGNSWRNDVRAYHAKKRKESAQPRPKVGDKITLCNTKFPGYGGTYTITANLGRKGFMLDRLLRINCRQIKQAVIERV